LSKGKEGVVQEEEEEEEEPCSERSQLVVRDARRDARMDRQLGT